MNERMPGSTNRQPAGDYEKWAQDNERRDSAQDQKAQGDWEKLQRRIAEATDLKGLLEAIRSHKGKFSLPRGPQSSTGSFSVEISADGLANTTEMFAQDPAGATRALDSLPDYIWQKLYGPEKII